KECEPPLGRVVDSPGEGDGQNGPHRQEDPEGYGSLAPAAAGHDEAQPDDGAGQVGSQEAEEGIAPADPAEGQGDHRSEAHVAETERAGADEVDGEEQGE